MRADVEVRTAEEFVGELRRLRAQAGQPSFRELSRIAERRRRGPDGPRVEPLPPSTTSEILAGKRLPRLPRLEFVESYVAACLVAGPAQAGEPDERVVAAELSRWREVWCALAEPSTAMVDGKTAEGPAGKPGGRQKARPAVWALAAVVFLAGAVVGAAGMRWWDDGQKPAAAGPAEPGDDTCLAAGEAAPTGTDVLRLPATGIDRSWWAADPSTVGLTTDGKSFDAAISAGTRKPSDALVIKSGVNIVEGRPYALAFTARADRDATIRVRVQDYKSPRFVSSYTRDLSVSPTGCRHLYRFTGAMTSDRSELTFQLGGQESDLRLKVSDVVLVGQ